MHVLSDYVNPHLLRNRSDSAPYPTSEKIRIRNRIRVISAPLHIRQKNMDVGVDVVKDYLIRSDPLSSLRLTLTMWHTLYFCSGTNFMQRLG
jgi:hypothetical protein